MKLSNWKIVDRTSLWSVLNFVKLLWDMIRHLASMWCKAHDLFRGISLSGYVKSLEGSTSLIDFSLVLFLVKRIYCPPIFCILLLFISINLFFLPKKKIVQCNNRQP